MISKKRYYGLALPIWECAIAPRGRSSGPATSSTNARSRAGRRSTGNRPTSRSSTGSRSRAPHAADARGESPTSAIRGWTQGSWASTLRWATDRATGPSGSRPTSSPRVFPANSATGSMPCSRCRPCWPAAPMTRTIFGHATVNDVHGEEMHKSKGNAIPFDEAAERIGADVMRWLYASANPAVNLNFGYGPGADVVRRFFLPLWNTYSFLVTYARLDGWTPAAAGTMTRQPVRPCWTDGSGPVWTGWSPRSAPPRRLRHGPGHPADRELRGRAVELVRPTQPAPILEGELDHDKQAAYQTLHEVLTTLTRVLAPFVPHFADALWHNLVVSVDPAAPDSVHLADSPSRAADPTSIAAVAIVRRVVALGRAARAESEIRTRQPLRRVRVRLPAGQPPSPPTRAVAAELEGQVREELNVKRARDPRRRLRDGRAGPVPAATGDRAAAGLGRRRSDGRGAVRRLVADRRRRRRSAGSASRATSST